MLKGDGFLGTADVRSRCEALESRTRSCRRAQDLFPSLRGSAVLDDREKTKAQISEASWRNAARLNQICTLGTAPPLQQEWRIVDAL